MVHSKRLILPLYCVIFMDKADLSDLIASVAMYSGDNEGILSALVVKKYVF